jgi:hypothetical protein
VERIGIVDCREVGKGQCSSVPGGSAGFRERIKARGAVAGRTHKSERKSSARNVTAENYSCVGSLCETEVINGPSEARSRTGLDKFIARLSAFGSPYPNTIPRRVVMKMEDNAFNDLPLLLAVPRAAQLLGISRAAAYRLAASGDLPVRRLGGRVYVVTAGLRDLAS